MRKSQGQLHVARAVAASVVLVGFPSSTLATDYFVDGDMGSDMNSGFTWPTAFKTLQQALDTAAGNVPNLPHLIRVARGTYFPDEGPPPHVNNDQDETFLMQEETTIIGGFVNGGIVSDPIANVTILSGDIDGDDLPNPDPVPSDIMGNNSFHVLTFIGNSLLSRTAVLDGFTITAGITAVPPTDPAGNCEVETQLDGWGGGVLLDGGFPDPPEGKIVFGHLGPTFQNCRFIGNQANDVGGAIGGRNIGVRLFTCSFENNLAMSTCGNLLWANEGGGAVSVTGELEVVECKFINNTSNGTGGALENPGVGGLADPQSAKLINCEFRGNRAFGRGGAVWLVLGGGGDIVNCLFAGNRSQGLDGLGSGGGINNESDIPLVNCTFVDNRAEDPGANPAAVGGGAVTTGSGGVTNCIFWGNVAVSSFTNWQVQQVSGVDCPDFCNIDGFGVDGCPSCLAPACAGNIDEDPRFFDPDGPDNVPLTYDDNDYRLMFCSPCVESGDEDQSVIPCDEFDLDDDGNTCLPSPAEPTPDLDLNDRALDNADQDATARVDMGAYEFVTVNPHPWDCEPFPDTFVAITDLLELLAQWNQVCTSCDQSGGPDVGVGIVDFLALLAAWNPPLSPSPQTISEAVTDAGLEYPADWDAFVAVMTDPNVSQAVKDNWRCWMDHYLDCHPRPFCFECACLICPDVDPYGNHWEP